MMILITVLVVYFAVLLGAVMLSIRPVRTPLFFSPSSIGISQEDVEFESPNATLRGWWLPHLYPRGVVIFAHGYLMNRSEWAALAAAAHRAGYACLIFDFHGHGKSGSGGIVTVGPRESKDVAAAVAFAKTRLPRAKVAIVGSSMGAAATVLAVTSHTADVDALVLDSCYSSLASAITGWWHFIGGKPLALLLAPSVIIAWAVTRVNPFGVNITQELESVDMPVLVVHGEEDRLQGPDSARRNFKALSIDHDSQIVIFHGANHGEAKWSNSQDYEKLIIEFLDATIGK